jgi:alcohol dehydrogenase class IV
MKSFCPDWIIALGGGSPMDAAKAMWIYYEHPELSKLSDIEAPNPFPKLRSRARLVLYSLN